MEIRLQKFLAKAGISSRRQSEILISEGKVKVNDKVITELGYKINDEIDTIKYLDEIVTYENKKVYILLNKPEGYITTSKDQFNRPTVLDIINNVDERIYPVGRLDCDTSGLLILTNDGELAYKLTHPKHNIDKKYIANLNKKPKEADLDLLRKGIKIENYISSPAKVKVLKKESNMVEITIHEGKNRQVRKMFSKIGYNVIKLKRVSIGSINIGNLNKGAYRFLNDSEVNYLNQL